MAFPTVPTIDYSYTAFQQAQGKNEFPGTQLDNDLAKLTEGLEDVRTFLERSFRSDGGILPGVLPTTGDLTAYGNDLADIYEATVAAKDEAVAAALRATASGVPGCPDGPSPVTS